MNWFVRLLIGGNIGLFAESTPAVFGLGVLGAALIAVGNIVLRTSHFRKFREQSDAVGVYFGLQFLLSAAVILILAFALKARG